MTIRRSSLKWPPGQRKQLMERFRDGEGHIYCKCCEKPIHEQDGQVVSIEHDPPWRRRKEILHSMASFQALSPVEQRREENITYRAGYCEPVHQACHRDKDGRGAPTNPILREMINCNEEPKKIRRVAKSRNPQSPFLRDSMYNIDTINDWLQRFHEPPKWADAQEREDWRDGLMELKIMQAGVIAQLEICFDETYSAIRASWEKSHASKVGRGAGGKERG